MPRGFIEVDQSQVQNMVRSFPLYLAQELRSLQREATSAAVQAFIDTVWDIALSANNFPLEYTDHLVGVLQQKAYGHAAVMGDTFMWEFDWTSLGDWNTLKLGYHQGAAIKGGGHIELGTPYSNQPLKNEFPTRYKAWQHVVDGTDWVTQKVSKRTGKLGKAHTWTPAHSAEETYAARVDIWGTMAPEWLILDMGTTFYPSVSPTGVTALANAAAQDILVEFTLQAVERAQYRADEVSSTGTIRMLPGQSSREFRSEGARLQSRSSGGQFSGGYI